MIYLIRIILFLLISFNANANENEINEILFKINNKVFTNIDLEKRIEYVALINDFTQSEFSESENNEILKDYISTLIFYEFYLKNNIIYKNLSDEVNLVFKKNFQDIVKLNEEEIKNFKFNTNIDLIRNKIIQEKLNLNKNKLYQKANKLDLLYNFNLQYLIIKDNLIDKKLIKKIEDRKKFSELKDYLKENNVDYFYKEEDINDKSIISNNIKKIIDRKIPIFITNEKEYITIISISKSLESYEGIYVKLINFKTSSPLSKEDLQCKNINETIDVKKTTFKEYEYSKLNNNIKNNLKSINDYILINDNNIYNYIVLCDLRYDEKLLKNINFNKKVNNLVKKIENNFIKKYKDEYNFIKIK
jgi:hypothetical protein